MKNSSKILYRRNIQFFFPFFNILGPFRGGDEIRNLSMLFCDEIISPQTVTFFKSYNEQELPASGQIGPTGDLPQEKQQVQGAASCPGGSSMPRGQQHAQGAAGCPGGSSMPRRDQMPQGSSMHRGKGIKRALYSTIP